MYNLKEEKFIGSNSGKKCIEHLEKIKCTQIENKNAIKLCEYYSMLFYKETNYYGAIPYIQFTYIPINLFKKYDITVVEDKQIKIINNDIEHVETKIKKTSPTLFDGWYIYILIIILLSIFYERMLGWIVATIIFLLWRVKEIDKYN